MEHRILKSHDVKLTGLRSEIFAAYAPVTLQSWLLFVRDCSILTVTKSRSIRIFESGLEEQCFVTKANAKARGADAQARRRAARRQALGRQRLRQNPGPYRSKVSLQLREDQDEMKLRTEDEFGDCESYYDDDFDVEEKDSEEACKPTTLSYEAFGFCVHRLAHLTYEHESKPCQTFTYMHLLPLAARKRIGFHMVSLSEPAILRWLNSKDTKPGLGALFSNYAPRGDLTLKNFRRMLKDLDIFPEYVSQVSLQDAFYETLQEFTWEDCLCNLGQQSQVFTRVLDLPGFTECLTRIFVKSDLFTKTSTPQNLVPLLDRFLFPRRFLRSYKARRSKQSLQGNSQRNLTFSARKRLLLAENSRTNEGRMGNCKISSSNNSYCAENFMQEESTFSLFRDICRNQRRRKVAQLEILEFISLFADVVQHGVGWPGVLARLHASGPNRHSVTFKAPIRQCELETVRKAVATAAKEHNDSSKKLGISLEPEVASESEEYSSDSDRSSQSSHSSSEQNRDNKTAKGRLPSSPGKRATKGEAPSGYVTLEEHEIVLTKLKALEDALDLGDMEDLDWDGTLEDAELKMKDLIPQMMSEDPSESAAASDKFEMLDKIVRNHKDYKEREARLKQEWEDNNITANNEALEELRAIFPPCIAQGTAMSDLREVFKLPAALAKRVFQRKALRLIHMEQEEIARMHIADLCGTFSTQGLDLREVRAVYACLPLEFGADGDGKKAAWRDGVLNTLQDMIKKLEAGSLPKAHQRNPAYDAPVTSTSSANSENCPRSKQEESTSQEQAPVRTLRRSTSPLPIIPPLQEALNAALQKKTSAAPPPAPRKAVMPQDFFSELRRKASVIGTDRTTADEGQQQPNTDVDTRSASSSHGNPQLTLVKIARELKAFHDDDSGDEVEVKQSEDSKQARSPRQRRGSAVSQLIKQCAQKSATSDKNDPVTPDKKVSHAPPFQTPNKLPRGAPPAAAAVAGGLMGELSAVLRMRNKSMSSST